MSAEFCVLIDGDTALIPTLFDEVREDALDAAKGCFVYGQLFGFALWAVVFSLFFSLT